MLISIKQMESIEEMVMLEVGKEKFPVRVKEMVWTESTRDGSKGKGVDKGMSKLKSVIETTVVKQQKDRRNVQEGAFNAFNIGQDNNKVDGQRLSDGVTLEMNQLNEINNDDLEEKEKEESNMDRIIEGSINMGLGNSMDPNGGVEWQMEEEIGEGFSIKSLDEGLMDVGHTHETSDNGSEKEMVGDNSLSLINGDIRNMGLTKDMVSNIMLDNFNEQEEGFTKKEKRLWRKERKVEWLSMSRKF